MARRRALGARDLGSSPSTLTRVRENAIAMENCMRLSDVIDRISMKTFKIHSRNGWRSVAMNMWRTRIGLFRSLQDALRMTNGVER